MYNTIYQLALTGDTLHVCTNQLSSYAVTTVCFFI